MTVTWFTSAQSKYPWGRRHRVNILGEGGGMPKLCMGAQGGAVTPQMGGPCDSSTLHRAVQCNLELPSSRA